MARSGRDTVLEASVVLKWLLNDEDQVDQALALRDDYLSRGTLNLMAPSLLVYELINGTATAVRQRRITDKVAKEEINTFLGLGVDLRAVDQT